MKHRTIFIVFQLLPTNCKPPSVASHQDLESLAFKAERLRTTRAAAPSRVTADSIAQDCIHIGRLTDNDVVLDYPIVSGHHARIVFERGEPWIEDCNSRNGIAIGSPENKVTRAKLSIEDSVFFGSLRIPAERLLAGRLTMGNQAYTDVKMNLFGPGKVVRRRVVRSADLAPPRPRGARRRAHEHRRPSQLDRHVRQRPAHCDRARFASRRSGGDRPLHTEGDDRGTSGTARLQRQCCHNRYTR